ncbi:TPA: tail fiber protein [Escherichia coli]|uniref:tail fiber protein n=1 Tax=Escherichia coli TaxID=562 RepID=UPI000BE98A42|nr:tail fiber protein [Escherichia coli]EKJ2720596.1 tail fiber protein [Escherichia coli]MBB8862919.1 tail fiber protein [Escherichia coli]HAX2148226.1 integrase [Escherichia coli]HCO9287400.1 tail fiber protein [Escherichia coli]
MHRIDTKTAQKDKFGAGKNGFTRGNPQTGTPATDLDDDYFDMLQEELCGVVEASGASLEKGRHDQLLTALRALLLSRKNPFGDIKSDGTVKTALENLGLGEGSALPVGVPVPWPSATPPTGWLKCNGAAFSAEEYPELAKAYPTNKLPDLRGEFIRGWDDGRGVDSGRTLLTNQEHAVISHNHGIPTKVGSVTNIPYGIEQVISDETIFSSAKTVGVDYWSNSERIFTYTTGGRNGAESVSSPDASSLIKETRPRNLAFAYIVRAA